MRTNWSCTPSLPPHLGGAAEIHQQQGPGQVQRHEAHKDARLHEMGNARPDEKGSGGIEGEGLRRMSAGQSERKNVGSRVVGPLRSRPDAPQVPLLQRGRRAIKPFP